MTNTATVRPYTDTDHHDLLKAFDLNTPEYFDPKERVDFENFLANTNPTFFTAILDNEAVGCMGYKIDGRVGKITWAFIHPHYQGSGIGTALYRKCLTGMKEAGCDELMVRTSQKAYGFFERLGFKTTYSEADFWGEGLDLVSMEIKPLV